jgi:hypothetical protein
MIPVRILKTCTPPKMEVALNIWRYDERSDSFSFRAESGVGESGFAI